ncbi:hypothetical protein [Arthrobacter wenxiniae]|uniref:Uncharacterized protein n=1 Tax=Arthrobacter wenxiniae TaxID=2713570 RepID=A0A7Y7IIA8_9MICC|nr:hypothetical protein [Arthrobacter wenxiniae]NVM95371.1 hypothetical protein [Arthrobacter wenxiniae]
MSESTAPRPDDAPGSAGQPGAAMAKRRMPVWLRRTIVGAVAAIVLVVAYFIASVTVPLAWATSIRDQTGGKLGNAIPLGMFYGFVFSFVPVAVAWQAHHKKLDKWVRIGLLVVAVLLTLPNLLTLAVLYGTTGSAADARSIWTTGGANWFGTWSQIFMVAGVVCAVGVIVLGRAWISRGRKIRQIKAAERLVRVNDAAKARAARDAGRAAEKRARAAGRAAEKSARAGSRTNPGTPLGGVRPATTPQNPPSGEGPGTPPDGTPQA